MNLLEKTIKQLHNHRGEWAAIARELDASYSWITKLAARKIPNPSVVTIERLLTIMATR